MAGNIGEFSQSFTAFVLNKSFMAIWPLDRFTAFIWTDSYWEASDFQLETPWDIRAYAALKVGNYLYLRESDQLMVIETIGITYDVADKGNRKIVAKGRALSSLIERRIVWGPWSFSNANFQTAMLSLIDSNLVNPSDSRRQIPILSYQEQTGLGALVFNGEGYGDNLYELIQSGSEMFEIGFKVIFIDGDPPVNRFIFYKGVDRSYDQSTVPPVIFSESFENLGPSRFGFDTKEYKTVALARSREDEGYTTIEVGALDLTGLDRREMFVDGQSTEIDDITTKAMEKLAKVNTLQTLDAELDAKRQFIFGRDFFVGDIVQIVTNFGLDAKARLIKFTRSWDETGYSEIPTFKVLEV